MPYKDPAKKAAYQRRYMKAYLPAYMERYLAQPDEEAGTKAEKVRLRKAAWFQKHKDRLTAKKRQQRRAAALGERVNLALGILDGPRA